MMLSVEMQERCESSRTRTHVHQRHTEPFLPCHRLTPQPLPENQPSAPAREI